MNIDENNRLSQIFDSGTAGLLISLIKCSETSVPIRIGSFSLYFPGCMFGEDRSRYSLVETMGGGGSRARVNKMSHKHILRSQHFGSLYQL